MTLPPTLFPTNVAVGPYHPPSTFDEMFGKENTHGEIMNVLIVFAFTEIHCTMPLQLDPSESLDTSSFGIDPLAPPGR